ncbi:DUF302 domain-containing protein [Mycolicibacterium sp. S2-37]|uniref:DUF302 domain-containing protein n=1 Tax=Mycolicibacterium sp. S2-37 TaxID=2810297 RepID=UPI001A94A35B|nr:DUF302 domain-containing protein [Mycolicibacterium sp. S2-37]MBO0677661.1 DUF302 domain-containing protein [Mycolicibacterium sp. S2-37]
MDIIETPFTGVRLRHRSAKTFDDLLAALLADVGARPVPIGEIAAATASWSAYEREVGTHAGPSGFMLFATLDHGEWIGKAGIEQKVLRVVIGNPLIAITMMRHDVTAGLFAPVELLLTEEADGSALTYVRPSSLMVVTPDAALLDAAATLDAKLAALVESIV